MRLPLDSVDPGFDGRDVGSVSLVDHHGIEWPRVARTAYLVRQELRYEYPAPVRDLRQRLVVVPPERHGDQRRVLYRVDVRGARPSGAATVLDDFGNLVVDIHVPRVRRQVVFETWWVAERTGFDPAHAASPEVAADPRLLETTPLTAPDAALADLAGELAATGLRGAALATAVSTAVYRRMRFEAGVTHVGTTAAEAFAEGRGVCQDLAHVTLTLCRMLGLRARYVSGQLLGEGASHAWVEVVVPAPTGGGAHLLGLDPTHDRPAGPGYIVVAVGRDYADVCPTSGTYEADHTGTLTSTKRAGVMEVEYAA